MRQTLLTGLDVAIMRRGGEPSAASSKVQEAEVLLGSLRLRVPEGQALPLSKKPLHTLYSSTQAK